MSEKHLTELPWKTLAVRQGVKDLGLQKALFAYGKLDATKEPAKALEALKEISELAIKLKKTCATKADVVEHLDEMVKEVKKISPPLEARIKKDKPADKAPVKPAEEEGDEDEEEEKEAAEFKRDLKKQMVSALAQVKLRAPDPKQDKEPKPQLKFMAYLAGKGSAVIVARRVGSGTKKLLPDIAGGASGGKFVQGECIFEKNAHTFVLQQVPGGLAQKLAKALQTETGQKYMVRARSIDGSVTLDSETDVDPDTDTGKDPAAEWKTKVEQWTPAIKEAMAARGPDAGTMAKLYAQAMALSKPGGDTVQALAKLTECHGLAMTWAETKKQEKGTSPVNEKAAQWKERDSKLAPHLKAFLQAGIGDLATVKTQYGAATAAAGKGDYDAAFAILDKLEPMVVRGAVTGMVGWQKAKIEIINQIRQLQDALVKTKRPLSLEIAKELESVPTGLQIHPDSEENRKALETYLSTDEVIDKVETIGNPLGIKIGIREPLLKAMAGLSN